MLYDWGLGMVWGPMYGKIPKLLLSLWNYTKYLLK
jgi:hypothetical protein